MITTITPEFKDEKKTFSLKQIICAIVAKKWLLQVFYLFLSIVGSMTLRGIA